MGDSKIALLVPARPAASAAMEAAVRLKDSPRAAAAILSDLPRALLLGTLVFAPWAYGCTRRWAIDLLNLALFAVLGLALVACLVRRTWPRVHPALALSAGLLLVQGWWMTLNAGFTYDAALQPHARSHWAPTLPGAVDFAVARPSMVGLSAMLGAACVACDAAASRRWRRRLWATMALTGCSVIVLGLVQKVTHAPGIFWRAEGHASTFFGPFRYHANAGSFINVVWPLTAALLAGSIRRRDPLKVRVFWSVGLVLAIVGALANTSRASGLIAGMLLGVWMAWMAIRFIRKRNSSSDPTVVAGVGLLLAAVIAIVLAVGGFDATVRHWQEIDRELRPDNSRLMVARVCLEMLPCSGWLGFGPGTFPTAFPFFNRDTSDATRGVWLQAHQDYLQTLIEWGWIGTAWWALAIGGGLGWAAWMAVRHRQPSRDRYLHVGASTAIVAVLVHSLGDFPLQIASIQLYIAVLLGILWSAGGWMARENSAPGGD